MKKVIFLFVLSGLFFIESCKSNDPSTINEKINNWMYEEMDFWYYWTDFLPQKTSSNLNPADYYESLLYSGDQFSFLYDNYQELLDLLNGESVESGFEFKLYYENALFPEVTSTTNVVMQITYVKPSNTKENSPGAEIGLKRGDIIYKINDTQITIDNYQTLLAKMSTTYIGSYKRYNEDLEVFENQADFSITPIFFPENPIFLNTVIEEGGKKIGYFVYTFFSPGDLNEYDDAVDAAFASFQSAGIEELIIDLRFNGGGSVSSAINLASLLADGVTATDVALKRSYNDQLNDLILNDPKYGSDFFIDNFDEKSENISSLMASGKIHFIVSSRTASASEQVINAIRPYSNVYLIGEQTVGKDVGSITIPDETNPNNNWALQPIVVKFLNSNNQDYPDGFTPDVLIDDRFTILKPLGDIDEPLLNAALGAIGVISARMDRSLPVDGMPIFNSIDRKKWNQKLFIDAPAIRPETIIDED